MITQADKEQFIYLKAQGITHKEIQKQLNISEATCTRLNKQLKNKIKELQKETATQVKETLKANQKERLKILTESLTKINTSLEVADLNEIPPHRLLDLQLKYIEAIKQENPDSEDQLSKVDSILERINHMAVIHKEEKIKTE